MRYRWLRENAYEWYLYEKDGYGGQQLLTGVALDAAIDKAMEIENAKTRK
jgi:hypothetical protein